MLQLPEIRCVLVFCTQKIFTKLGSDMGAGGGASFSFLFH